jgi:single-strand DNA-binding protein
MASKSALPHEHLNEVRLVGRLAAAAEDRLLPSGDALATFRMVVERPEGTPGPRVDTLDCSSWRADIRRAAAGWAPGDVLSIEGRLRRRFWRAGAGVASRYEVEVSRAKRVQRAG